MSLPCQPLHTRVSRLSPLTVLPSLLQAQRRTAPGACVLEPPLPSHHLHLDSGCRCDCACQHTCCRNAYKVYIRHLLLPMIFALCHSCVLGWVGAGLAVRLLFALPLPMTRLFEVVPKSAAFHVNCFSHKVDKLDGYSFVYPAGWLPVTVTGNDCFFRNPVNIDENLFVDISSPSSSQVGSCGPSCMALAECPMPPCKPAN
jgi:hypothetical protein